MWQDGLALLIVAVAALALLRLYVPAGWFRFGASRRNDDELLKSPSPPAGGCGGCASGSSCVKMQVKVYPVAVHRSKP